MPRNAASSPSRLVSAGAGPNLSPSLKQFRPGGAALGLRNQQYEPAGAGTFPPAGLSRGFKPEISSTALASNRPSYWKAAGAGGLITWKTVTPPVPAQSGSGGLRFLGSVIRSEGLFAAGDPVEQAADTAGPLVGRRDQAVERVEVEAHRREARWFNWISIRCPRYRFGIVRQFGEGGGEDPLRPPPLTSPGPTLDGGGLGPDRQQAP